MPRWVCYRRAPPSHTPWLSTCVPSPSASSWTARFSLYRAHLPKFVVLMLPFAFVNALLSVVLTVIRTAATSGGAAPEIMTGVAVPLALMPVLTAALIIVQVIGFALVTSSASSAYVGEPATVRAVIETVRPELGSVIWLAVLVAVRLAALFGVGALASWDSSRWPAPPSALSV